MVTLDPRIVAFVGALGSVAALVVVTLAPAAMGFAVAVSIALSWSAWIDLHPCP